jgi:hypothetical protein
VHARIRESDFAAVVRGASPGTGSPDAADGVTTDD